VRPTEHPPEALVPKNEDDGSGDDEDVDMVDVEFEWFNMKPEIDFHGIKSLLRQLFDVDAQLFDISAFADLILSQPTIGSTVKVDGDETDPYAFLTILNMQEHRDKPVMQSLINYLTQKTTGSELSQLSSLLGSSTAQVGLILAERLINVPTEIAPPMYTMIIDEIEAAVEDEEPYEFSHYLIVSKTYQEIASTLDQEEAPKQKKSKSGRGKETFYFHPEDEVLQRHALAYGGWEYTKDEGEGMADSKRAFQELGVKPQGHAILIEASKFEGAVKTICAYVGQ